MTTPISGSTASLRPTGILRYISALFLATWLAGWVVGEVLAGGFLIMLVRSLIGSFLGSPRPIPNADWIAGGAAAFAFLFLIVWLTLWTFGGLAALNELLRSLAGEDLISASPSGLTIVRRAGPIRRTRTFDRSAIRRIRIRTHDKALVIDTTSGTHAITQFGTADERQTIADWLRRHLALKEHGHIDENAAPPGWTATVEGGKVRLGVGEVRARRTASIIVWSIVGLVSLAWFGSLSTGAALGSIPALVITLMLAIGAAWVTWARREWIVQPGQLTSYWRFATWESETAFKSARLEVEHSRDSDNDDRYQLTVRDAHHRRTISSGINDDADVIDLARWLAARTGFPLTLPHGMRPRLTTPVSEEEMRGSRP